MDSQVLPSLPDCHFPCWGAECASPDIDDSVRCTACTHARYCSEECRIRSWPLHMACCAQLRKDHSWMEERSLVTPSLTQMGEEVTAFVQEAHDIIIAAARSALKLEQPSNLRRSHALELRFEWNPKKGKEKRIVLLNVVTLEHNPDFTPDHAVEKLRILVQVVFEIGRRNG